MTSSAAELYLSAVEANLLCGKTQKKRIMENIHSDVYGCFEGCTDEITTEMIVVRFGKPEELAASFLKDMSGAEIKSRLSKKKIAIAAVVAGIVLAVIAVIIGVRCYQRWEFFSHPDGYIEETPVFYVDETELTEALEELYGKENVY